MLSIIWRNPFVCNYLATPPRLSAANRTLTPANPRGVHPTTNPAASLTQACQSIPVSMHKDAFEEAPDGRERPAARLARDGRRGRRRSSLDA